MGNRHLPETVLEAGKRWQFPNLRELYASRDLLHFLVLRDVKVRYRQTALGIAWLVLVPMLTLAMMSAVFGRFLGLESDSVPYPLFCFAGLVLWNYFSQAVSGAAVSLTSQSELIEKIYFPRLIIPLSAILSSLINLAVSLVLLGLLMAAHGAAPSPRLLLCLPAIALTVLLAVSVGSVLAALGTRFRDVHHLTPFLLQLWLFASPVVYSSSSVPENWRGILAANPMTGIIDLFRYAMFDISLDPWPSFMISAGITLALLPMSMLVFRSLERSFADVI